MQKLNRQLNQWRVNADPYYIEIEGKHCKISIEPRPAYCDRGNFIARVELKPNTSPADLYIDGADYWPRYYFNLERAKLECEAWLEIRNEVLYTDAPLKLPKSVKTKFQKFLDKKVKNASI